MRALVTALLLLLLKAFWIQVANAGLHVYYYRQPIPPNTNPTQSWLVEGLATWISENAFSDNLDCNTTSNNGAGVGWTGQVAINPFWIQTVANGRRLVLDSFTNSNLGIYTCSDSTTNESVTINITSANPAIQAVSDVVTIETGSSGQLKVYVSGVPDPTSTSITWFKVGPGGSKTELKEPMLNFSSDHRTLLLSNVQGSDGGLYGCTVTLSSTTVSSTLYLNISSAPILKGHLYQVTSNYTSRCPAGYTLDGDGSLCIVSTENSTAGYIGGHFIMPPTEFALVAVVVLLAASLTCVSLSFAAYCCYVQQLSKAKLNIPHSLEKCNVEPYLMARVGPSSVVVDPVYSNIK